SLILASVARIRGRNGHNNQSLKRKFPTQRNWELIGPYQGIKSAYQGNFCRIREGCPGWVSPPGPVKFSQRRSHAHAARSANCDSEANGFNAISAQEIRTESARPAFEFRYADFGAVR